MTDTATNNANEQATIICKRCGRPAALDQLQVDENSQQEYFRCLLGQRPFERVVKLFNGVVVATFNEPSAVIQHRLEEFPRNSTHKTDDANLIGTLSELRHVDPDTGVSTTILNADEPTRLKNLDDVEATINTMGLSAVELLALRQASAVFIMLLSVLSASVLNDDFFKGVGLS